MSFIEEHRRKQIIDMAIKTIASRGYSQTALADIAKEAGISKGVISYYFKGKEELVEQVILALVSELNTYVKSRIDAKITAWDKLRAYIEASFDFIRENRNKFLANSDLWINLSSRDERGPFGSLTYERCRSHVKKILHEGQARGEFRPLPLKPLTAIIQGMIDGVSLQWAFDEDAIDLGECREGIFEIVECLVLVKD